MISTHVLDTARGGGAADLRVVLEVRRGDLWHEIARATTDANGRIPAFAGDEALPAGTYRLTFDTGAYQRANGVAAPFFPDVQVVFEARIAGAHYHVPLLLSPFGYSTYRGA